MRSGCLVSRCFVSRFALLALSVSLASLVGCTKSGPALHPVQGQVLFNEQPVAGAQVIFQPSGAAGEANPLTPSGTTAADGKFTLHSHPHGEGAAAGEYVVLVNQYPENAREVENAKNKLPAKYSNPAAGLIKVTVKEGDNELPPFKLTP